MDDYIDAYDLLNVPLDADVDAIKKAYKKLSLQFHPDKVKARDRSDANESFVAIKTAYDILSDESRRKLYDGLGVDFGPNQPEAEMWRLSNDTVIVPVGKFTLCAIGARLALWLLTFPYVPTIIVLLGGGLLARDTSNIETLHLCAFGGIVVAIYSHSYFTLIGDIGCLTVLAVAMDIVRPLLEKSKYYLAAAIVGTIFVAWLTQNWWWYICVLLIVGVIFVALGGLMACGVNRVWLEMCSAEVSSRVKADRQRLREWRERIRKEKK